MKMFVPLICLLTILTAGCKKNVSQCNTLIGLWELQSVHGGMMEGGPYSPNNGNLIRFTATSFITYGNGQVVSTSQYTLSKDTCPENNRSMDKITFGQSSSFFVEVSGNELTRISGMIAADGTISTWKRVGSCDSNPGQ